MSDPTRREDWPDALRAISATAVVLLHVAAPWLQRYHASPVQWQIANLVGSSVRAAVPLFFMLAGYLAIKSPVAPAPFLKRRLTRVLVPWLVWAMIYVAYQERGMGEFLSFSFFRTYYHLWFLPALAGCYLLTPLLWQALRRNANRNVRFLLTCWLLLPGLPSLIQHAGYFIAGYWLGTGALSSINKKGWVVLYLAGFVVTSVGTTFLTAPSGAFSELFYDYSRINVALMAFSVFALVKQVPFSGTSLKWFRRIGESSFGIYLVHPLLLDLLRTQFPRIFDRSPLGIPLTVIVVLIISWGAVDLVRRFRSMPQFISGSGRRWFGIG